MKPKQYKIVRLQNFKGGLHLARGLTNAYDKSLETLHSDTLKSAIFVCALQLFPEIGLAENKYQAGKDFLESFKISSAFPFFKEDYYYPTPQMLFLQNFEPEISEKERASVKFIHQDLFKKYIEDANTFVITANQLKSKATLDKKRYNEIIKSETYQHVAIPRDYGSDAIPYYVDKLYFEENAGLYFLLDIDEEKNPETLKQVKAALKLLADNGIGTDRNNGNGQFNIKINEETFDITDNTTKTHDLSLSLYCPQKVEIEGKLNDSYYELIKRGGYISSPQNETHLTVRKRSIHFFTAGSVFKNCDTGIERTGKIVDLKPEFDGLEHPIWRDGQAIFVPIKYKLITNY